MITLWRALSAEILKTKRTLTLALTFLAPLAIAFLALAVNLQYGDQGVRPGENPWHNLFQNSMILWGLLMLPLYVTLETGLLTALEHNNKTWKQLYALPLPRWSVYAAKQLMALGLIGLSTVMLGVLVTGVGLLLTLIRPDLGYTAPIPWETILQVLALTFLAAWLIISLHLWIAARWSSFIVAMGAGIVATVAGVIVVNSDWAGFYPWTLPGQVSIGFMQGEAVGLQVVLGTLGGIVVALVGGWDVIRQDVL